MQAMSPRQRLLAAIRGGTPDRLPVTTHHVMQHFLDKYVDGVSYQSFFDRFGMDAILWVVPHRPDPDAGEYHDPLQTTVGFLDSRRVSSDSWHVESEDVPDPDYQTTRYRFVTPKGTLTIVVQRDAYTTWVTERLVKRRSDVDVIGQYVTSPKD